MYRYARAVYMHHGGDPRDLDELPWDVIMDWLTIHWHLDVRLAKGGIPDE